MKQVRTFIFIAFLALGTIVAKAQNKVAHISTDQLISLMPETKALDTELKKMTTTYENELKAEQDKLQAKLKKYDAEAPSQTEAENNKRRAEVQAEQQKLMQAMQAAREDLAKKRNEKLKPILEKAQKAINEVAKAQGYDYVLEASTLVIANGKNLLDDVKAKLGI